MTENNDFKAKINDATYKAEQISDIALCAIIAARSINPADREKHIEGVLHGIISLCEALATELDALADETASEDVDEWQEELCNIFKRLDLFGRSEVLVYADKVEKKAQERKT